MRTDDLVALLARGAGPAPQALLRRYLLPALALGLAVALTGGLLVLGPAPATLFATPAPWIKLVYGALLAAAAVQALGRLGRPGAHSGSAWKVLAVVVLAMLLAGAAVYAAAPDEARRTVLLGHDWTACLRRIPLYALPVLAGALWGLRRLAPTRLALTGFAAGIAAGAVGACAYALSCTEVSPTFIALWYSGGILLSGAMGALIGPRLLRW